MLQRHDRGMDTESRVQYLPGEVRTKNTPRCFKEKKRKPNSCVFQIFCEIYFHSKKVRAAFRERKNTN
jgi:hypothetical protein